MNWNQIMNLFDGQGFVFWSAVTAVTLGLTMLSVAIVFQTRKVLSNRKLANNVPKRSTAAPPAATAAPARINVTDEGYRPEGFVPVAAVPESTDPLLNSLLDRLQSSADRLERIHVSLGRGNSSRLGANDSMLKPTTDEVDYVYQAGRA